MLLDIMTYGIGDAIRKSDEFNLALCVLPVREQRQH